MDIFELDPFTTIPTFPLKGEGEQSVAFVALIEK
jgi:hypothetical protein